MVIRVGVVGYGLRGSIAREAHRPGAGSVVTAVCDPSERSRAEAAEAFDDVLLTADLEDLLSSDVDAVMVLTPDHLHTAPVLAALEASLPVFCEKPLTVDLAEADQILATARRTGTRLYVGHNMRHLPVITLMRSLIEQGRIGAVKAIWCRHFVGHGGDYYFKDWHADRSRSHSLLLQKGAHDIDVIHWLAGAPASRVQAMGAMSVYAHNPDRTDRSGQRMTDWWSLENWPATAHTGLNPVVDVEDLSHVQLALRNGVLATYDQCHYTPDYWRNYTVIGTHGRIENMGDTPGSQVHLWNRRHQGSAPPDETFEVPTAEGGHGGADRLLVDEFLRFAVEGGITSTSPVGARDAVAAGIMATRSLREGSGVVEVPALDAELVDYFAAGLPGPAGQPGSAEKPHTAG